MTMRTLTYHVSFNTPAFLGNAEQQAQWRTPPLKALIRQWWRVVKAPQVGYSYRELLTLENALFGAAFDDGEAKSHRSLVQLRLSDWGLGGLSSVAKGEMVRHQEVPGQQVGANLYLGYGPIGGSVHRSAIKPATVAQATLKLRFPSEHEHDIKLALQMAHWFGSVGSRSRNGFGSIHFEGESILFAKDLNTNVLSQARLLLPLSDCLRRDWAHAIGGSNTHAPAIWRLLKVQGNQLTGFDRWEDVMLKLAEIKIAVRTSEFFEFQGGGKEGHLKPQPRHFLSYPSGSNHSVKAWGKDGRMANQVRFKVHRRLDGKFMAVVAHLPCALPQRMAEAVRAGVPEQVQAWAEVHRILDSQKRQGLIRLAGAST